MNGIDQIEQELADLRARFRESAKILDDLHRIQVHFEEMTQTQKDLESHLSSTKEYLENLPNFTQIELNKQVTLIEENIENRHRQLEADFINFKQAFFTEINELKEKINHQSTRLNQLEKLHTQALENPDISEQLKNLEISVQDISSLAYTNHSDLRRFEHHLWQVQNILNPLKFVAIIILGMLIIFLFFK